MRRKVKKNQVIDCQGYKQNPALVTKAKTPTKETCTKSTKVEKTPSRQQPADGNKTTKGKVQAIYANHIAEFEIDSESEQESDQEQIDIDILLNMESD